MSHPVVHDITQGETLSFELRIVGEDLTDATPSLAMVAGLDPDFFTTTKILPDTLSVQMTNTEVTPPGRHALHVNLSWPDGDVREEVAHKCFVAVSASVDYRASSSRVIDGGRASTSHTNEIDGDT